MNTNKIYDLFKQLHANEEMSEDAKKDILEKGLLDLFLEENTNNETMVMVLDITKATFAEEMKTHKHRLPTHQDAIGHSLVQLEIELKKRYKTLIER